MKDLKMITKQSEEEAEEADEIQDAIGEASPKNSNKIDDDEEASEVQMEDQDVEPPYKKMKPEVFWSGSTYKSQKYGEPVVVHKIDPIRLPPEPSDPLAGLINSQGLPVLHLAYVLVNWLYLDFCLVD